MASHRRPSAVIGRLGHGTCRHERPFVWSPYDASSRGTKFPLSFSSTEETHRCRSCFSPSSPAAGSKSKAFGSVTIPWMLMTGTNDVAAIGGQSVESRLEVYPNLPNSIDKFELVLKDAEHSVFTDRALPGEKGTRNPNHHRVILHCLQLSGRLLERRSSRGKVAAERRSPPCFLIQPIDGNSNSAANATKSGN